MADAGDSPVAPPQSILLARSNWRRLSLTHTRPVSIPAVTPGKPFSWLSLKGVLVGAEEASSPAVVGQGLSLELSAAWALFCPLERILLVAIVAAASNNAASARRKSVKAKDKILANIDRKLDYLFEEVSSWKEQQLLPFTAGEIFQFGLSSCGCRFENSSSMRRLSLDSKMSGLHGEFRKEQHDERRMSSISDWNSSVTSASELQLSTLALEQDVFNLQKDCDKKESTIKDLLDRVKCADAASSKRINELEDTISKKNLMITKLKKDVDALEQKVVDLTRLRRPSYLQSVTNTVKAPVMSSNLLYDMIESNPSPSDSDPSSPIPIDGKRSKIRSVKGCLDDNKENSTQVISKENFAVSMLKSPNKHGRKQVQNQLKEKLLSPKCSPSSFSNSRASSSCGELKTTKRRSLQSFH